MKIRLLRRRIFIHHLYVAAEYQGQGVGSMLLNGAKMKYG
ncbi:GNAT family N-acetyltransferase, partial [Vibrio cholerae]